MFDDKDESRRNAAFPVGLIAGGAMIAVHLALMFMLQAIGSADLMSWAIELVVMYMAAGSAASQQLRAQLDALEPLKGVQGAGVGAALITGSIVWLFLILRDVWVSAELGVALFVIPRIFIDTFIALGLGAWGSARVQRRHADLQSNSYYD